MSEDSDSRCGSTRRSSLTYAGALLSGGLLAGCTGNTGTSGGSVSVPLLLETALISVTRLTGAARRRRLRSAGRGVLVSPGVGRHLEGIERCLYALSEETLVLRIRNEVVAVPWVEGELVE